MAAIIVAITLGVIDPAVAAQSNCPDGIHIASDAKQLALSYRVTVLEATLNGLSVLGDRLAVNPHTLQQAAVATQKLSELIKALADGYNNCAVGKSAYEQSIQRLLPALQSDGKQLEALRQAVLANRKINVARFAKLLQSYDDNLKSLARLSGKSLDYERIAALLNEQLNQPANTNPTGQGVRTAEVLAQMDRIEERLQELPTPQKVHADISAISQQLGNKAEEAQAAYNESYELLQRFRFTAAIAPLERALAAVKLPDFYVALAHAYAEKSDLSHAEQMLRAGLAQLLVTPAPETEAVINNDLGLVLIVEGDLDGALAYSRHALEIDEGVFGLEHPKVAIRANNIGLILKYQGDLNGALTYSQRALEIDEQVFGLQHPTTATSAGNIGLILQDMGDLDGALEYSQRALQIDEQVFGPQHPKVAIRANNIGTILKNKGDLGGAVAYSQRALQIDEQVFGPQHPKVAIRANNIGAILKDKGDLDGALVYSQRALQIDEQVFGPQHPTVAIDANNIGTILKDKGDLDGALAYSQRALQIDEQVFGPQHPNVAIDANNIGTILQDKGDLNAALAYSRRAVAILTKVYGPQNPATVTAGENLDRIQTQSENQAGNNSERSQ